jgi:transcriptional regulator GlxA family with amidase domain
MMSSSMSLPFEIIQASERFNRIAKKGGFRIDMALCGPKKGLLKLHNGFNLHIEDLWEDAADANAVYLPALWGNPQQSLKAYLERIKPILTQLNERQSFILTVGTSSSFLAELGMLDGKNATTHWHYLEAFAKQYPKVKLQPNHLITRDKNLYCASTINAIADLTVHMMKRTYGAEIAQLAEAQFSPEIR